MRKSVKLGLVFCLFWLFLCNVAYSNGIGQKQATGLKVFHCNGQTFLIWNGIEKFGDLSAETQIQGGIPQNEFKKKYDALIKTEKEGRKVAYRIYRSESPINSTSLLQVEQVAEVQPLSAYYPIHLGSYWYGDQFKNKTIPRLAVEQEKPLEDGKELYVHTVRKSGKSYYAVIAIINGKENTSISEENSLRLPVEENPGEPEPVLQRVDKLNKNQHYVYQMGPAEVQYYMEWVHEPYSNLPRCFEWAIAIPASYPKNKPAALQLSLHSWGANPDSGTYWYDVKPSTIRISTVNFPPQDWWYGYRKSYGISKLSKDDIVFNYTERRLLHFVEWVRRHWSIDDNLIFVEGSSMGGSGAMSLGMKNGNIFCYVNSWVGIASWRNNDWFRKGERDRWGEKEELINYNGVKFDDWMDLTWWLRKYPEKETPFLSFANGKNDGSIGWNQAVLTVQSLWETKRPFVFLWGMGGHGQRSKFMMDPSTMALNKSIPAFRNCSLDEDLGAGMKLDHPKKFKTREGQILDDWHDGDSQGQINSYLLWENVSEKGNEYEITVYLLKDAPKETCTANMTPRRTQKFKAKKGDRFKWVNISLKDTNEIQSGEVAADKWGLVTIDGLKINKTKNRIKIWRLNSN
jgi:hypothetical protein